MNLVVVAFILWAVARAPGALQAEDGKTRSENAELSGAEGLDDSRPRSGQAKSAKFLAKQGPLRPSRQIDRGLQARLDRVVEKALAKARERSQGRVRPDNTQIGLQVIQVDGLAIRAERNPALCLRPASNAKLMTTSAALLLSGADQSGRTLKLPSGSLGGHFETRVEAHGKVQAGRLLGDLVLRGGGDPLLPLTTSADQENGPAFKDPGFREYLLPLCEALHQRGIQRIDGNLVLDEGDFPEPGPGPQWPDASQHWKGYCALAGAFTVNGGRLFADVGAGRSGGAAKVSIWPTKHGLKQVIRTETTSKKSSLVLGFEARLGRVLVQGKVPGDVHAWRGECAHPDPVQLYGSLLTDVLRQEGIELAGSVVRRRSMLSLTQVANSFFVCSLRSPMRDALVPINTHSLNGIADQLFFALGKTYAQSASRAGGEAALRLALQRVGVPTEGFVQVDGSGLSRADRVSPAMLCGLLGQLAQDSKATSRSAIQLENEAFAWFAQSLAVGGESGTLKSRMRGFPGRVRAKSGFIAGTSALSGYAQGRSGDYAFAILINYPTTGGFNTSIWKPMQDELCQVLVEWQGTHD